MKIDVPGIDEKDIDVRIENNTLTVHGERKFEKEEKEENYRRVERQYGSFTRTFTLPNTVDQENVQADYDKGVLKVKLAKKQEAKPKQIKVNVGSEPAARRRWKRKSRRALAKRRKRVSIAVNLAGGEKLRLPFHFVIWQSGNFVICKPLASSRNYKILRLQNYKIRS